MIPLLPVSVLREHSNGARFKPVLVNGQYQLQSEGGHVLTGMRGKIYEFTNQKNATSWLATNLERWKNKTEPTSIEHQLMLGKVYLDEGFDSVVIELKTINEYERGLWVIGDDDILDASGLGEDLAIDGGSAVTVY